MTADKRGRADANACFVCGPDNPDGLRLKYRLEGEECRARFTPGQHHCGFDGQTHGGILFSVLDDAMANWLFLQGIRAHTARCEIRFRQAVPVGTELEVTGRLVKRRGRLAMLEAFARRSADGAPVAESTATFMVVDG